MTRPQRPCPRCQHLLRVGAAGDVVAETCGHCGGVWLDRELADRFTDALALKSQLEISDSARMLSDIVGKRARDRHSDTNQVDLPCPICGEAMVCKEAKPSAVVVDCCEHHGTFFDRDELSIIAQRLGAKIPTALRDRYLAATALGVAGVGIGTASKTVLLGDTAAEVASDIVADVAIDTGVEVGLEILGAIFGAIFD